MEPEAGQHHLTLRLEQKLQMRAVFKFLEVLLPEGFTRQFTAEIKPFILGPLFLHNESPVVTVHMAGSPLDHLSI